MSQRKSQEIKELADAILYHKEQYYQGKPIISDAEYDALEDKLRKLCPEHPVLEKVGTEPKTEAKKVTHQTPMLSLAKTYDFKDLLSWADKQALIGIPKLDGNSLSLIYENGKLVLAKTRGNGQVGEDVTEKVKWVSECLTDFTISSSDLFANSGFEVRGELVITDTQFNLLMTEMLKLGLEKPTHPRNIVAGILGRKNHHSLARFFSFFAFDVQFLDGNTAFATEEEKLIWLEAHGFSVPPYRKLSEKKEIQIFLDEIKEMMEEGELGLDGGVFVLNDIKKQKALGFTAHHPRFKMSFKWQGESAITQIKEFLWATSRFGIVTPVAIVDEVFLSGANITNVTLHHAAYVKLFNLKTGDNIEIIRSGEVIPKFLRVVESTEGEACLPSQCPACNTILQFDDVRLICPNKTCPARIIGSILNWIRASEIFDLSEKRLALLIKHGFVKEIPDLYLLTEEQFLTLPLIKEKMAKKLVQAIAKSKDIELARFLSGLGIAGTGKTTWNELLAHYPSLEKIQNLTAEEIAAIHGFAQKSAEQIVSGLKESKELIKRLLHVGVCPKAVPVLIRVDGPLSGMSIAITGTLSKPREEISQLILENGGKVISSVSKNTSAVVTEDTSSTSSKLKKARELNIPLWSEKDLMEKIK